MSDDQHVGHVEYADSDEQYLNKESVISNERKSHEFHTNKAEAKQQVAQNNSEAITQLSQNLPEQAKVQEQPQQNLVSETHNHENVPAPKQEVQHDYSKINHEVYQQEEQHTLEVEEKQAEKVQQSSDVANNISKNEETLISQPVSLGVHQDKQPILSYIEPIQLSQKEQTVEILKQSKKQVEQQPIKLSLLEQPNVNISEAHVQNNNDIVAPKEQKEVPQHSSEIASKNQEKSLLHQNNNKGNSILDRAVYEKHISGLKIADERVVQQQKSNQQSEQNVQVKDQSKKIEIQSDVFKDDRAIQKQKSQLPVQDDNIIEKPAENTIELNRIEKVDNHQNQQGLYQSEQKIRGQPRVTKQLQELAPRGANARQNAPPKMQQNAGKNSEACKCEIM